METLLLILTCFFSGQHLQNLQQEPKSLRPSTTLNVSNFQFPEFQEGKVFFKSGRSTDTRLNYSYLHGAVMFLNSRGDTLLLTDKDRIDYIAIGKVKFYCQPSDGEFQLVADCSKVLLVLKKQFTLLGDKSSTSVQKYVASSSHDAPSSLLISKQGGEFYGQNNYSTGDYKVKTTFFLIDANRRLHVANKAGFLKIYMKSKPELAEYFRKNAVSFNNETSLRNLLTFCEQLN